MKNYRSYLIKKSSLLMLCLIFLSGFLCCGLSFLDHIAKIGKYLDKIKDVNYQLSLKKIDTKQAAVKIMPHIKAIKKLNEKIAAEEPIKDHLTSFVMTWDTEEKILESLNERNVRFMVDVGTFYMRGYVKDKNECKTLFPLFKP